MKRYLAIIGWLSCICLTSCSKKKGENPLAKNYYQQSLIAAEKNKREALVLIDKSISIEPTPRAYALKATLLHQINKYPESLELFEKVLQDPAAPATLKTDVSNNYACTLIALGQPEKAQEIWLGLTEDRFYLSPEVAWFNLGLLQLNGISQSATLSKKDTDQLEKAVTYFNKALKLNNDYIDCYYYLSLILIRLKRFEEAKQNLIQIVGLMPEHENAKELLHSIDKIKQQTKR